MRKPKSKRVLMLGYLILRSDPRVLREAKALQRDGYEVEVIGLADGEGATRLESGVLSRKTWCRKYRGGSAGLYVLSYLWFAVLATLQVAALCLRHRYRAVHVHTMPDLLVLCALPARLFGTRIVLDVHDTVPEVYQDKFGLAASHPLIRILRFCEKWAVRLADEVIAVNHEHADLLRGRSGLRKEPSVVFNAVDEEVFRPSADAGSKSGGKRLIVHGTLGHRHGIDRLLRAMPTILAAEPDTTLGIYGNGDAVPELRSLIAELRLEDSVELSGRYHPLEEMAEFVRRSDIGVIPYRRTHSTPYMLPTKLLEYLHAGLAVVTTRTLPVASLFADGELEIWGDDDPEHLAKLVLRQIRAPRRSVLPESLRWSVHQQGLLSLYGGLAA